ncbi:MAG: carboxypeptidase-like regulatory domain-containing protein, partial [Candidatus Acidiferrum sp.]
MEFPLAKRIRITSLSVVLLMFSAASSIYAQDPTGRIIGTILDPQGSAVMGVQVTITNVTTQVAKQAVTDKDGYYQVLDLPIGSYRVTMQHDGFRLLVFDNQILQINQSLRIDGKLELGTQTETVEVRDQVS